MTPLKIAVLDLYEGEANEGMRCIRALIEQFRDVHQLNLTYQVFDVRQKNEIADLSFDAYISQEDPEVPLRVRDHCGSEIFSALWMAFASTIPKTRLTGSMFS